jgi:FKBP-type peptidyl-prolyl cis-trans isomerase
MRRAAALAFLPLIAAAAIAGCSSSSSTSAAASSSDSYKSVTVSGAFDKSPTVKIPKVKGTGDLYTKTVIQGTGATLTASDGMVGNYVAYDWSGKTSKLLGSSYTQGTQSLFVGQLLPGLEKALVGQKLGSRVLAVIPPKDAFGSTGNSTEGIGASDTLVFVVDMDSTFATTGVSGTQAAAGAGLPTVTPPAANSTAGPTIKVDTSAAPPKTLQVKPLIKGNGAVVKKGQDLAVQYTGVIWRTGKVFDSSWSRNMPLTTVIGEGQVIPGWDTGLVGQTVGSRVLLVIPPADGYGSAGASQAGIKGTDTLVFVVDILAAV